MDELERNQSLCVVSHEEGCLSESIFDVYDVVFVAVVALLFSYHHSIISCVSSWTKSLISRRKASPEVLRLGTEVNRLKTELSQLSPISHFSAYFKTERLLNKTVEQYEAAVAEDRREHSPPVKVEFVVKTVSQAVGLVLLHWVAGIYALCIPSVALWPINFILRFPSVWANDLCGGSDSSSTPVSMFVFLYCLIFAVRVLLSK